MRDVAKMGNGSSVKYNVMDVCLLAGKIMLQSGGETYRVEDTMMRIAASLGYPNSHSYVTPTGIIFAIDSIESVTRFIRISERSTNLSKVTLVNGISRKISEGEFSIDEACARLKEIELAKPIYPLWMQIIAASIASGCSLIMFQGGWGDFLSAFIAGGLGYSCSELLQRLFPIKFFAESLASLLIGAMSLLFVAIGVGHSLDHIIVGSVIPLVPGLLITNAVRDLMAGHLISGLSKGAEAFLTAFAIGAGIAFILSFH